MSHLRKNKSLKICLLGTIAACALSGCEVGPNYHTPELRMPDNFATAPNFKDKPAVINAAEWWKSPE